MRHSWWLPAGPSAAHRSRRRPLDYGRSTTFTVSLTGITETEAACTHEACTFIRLSRPRRRHSRIFGSKLSNSARTFRTNADNRAPARQQSQKTTHVSHSKCDPLCVDQVVRIHTLRSVRHSRQFVEWQSLADVYITPESGQIADVSVGPLRADFVAK